MSYIRNVPISQAIELFLLNLCTSNQGKNQLLLRIGEIFAGIYELSKN